MKRNSRMFIVLFAFFIVVAIGALVMLNGSHSVFNRDAKSIGAQTAVMSKTVIGDEPTEDAILQDTIEEVTDIVEEVVEDVEVTAEKATGNFDAVSDDTAEGAGSGDGAADSAADSTDPKRIRYFKYTTCTTKTVLNFRKEPSEDSKIMYKLAPGTPGYVLQPGNEWSMVVVPQYHETGYCATEYLDLVEITKEDFPEEYAELVIAPEEALTY